MPAGVFREVWQEEAKKAETLQKGEWDMKAIGYCRVSSDEQEKEGISIEAQQAKIDKYKAWKEFLEIKILKEIGGVSGTKPLIDRKAGALLLEMIEKKEVSDVIVTRQDRLFRSLKNCITILDDWEESVVLHLIDEGGVIDTSTPDGWLQVMIRALFAEYEARIGRFRTKTALHHKKSKGEAYNHPPYGWRVEGGEMVKGKIKGGRFVEDEVEQRVIKDIKIMKEGQQMSLQVIADTLNLSRIPAKKGGQWYPATVKNVLDYKGPLKENVI